MNNNPDPYLEREGNIVKKTRGVYFVASGEKVIPCTLSAKLRKQPGNDGTGRSNGGRSAVRQALDLPVVDPVAINDRVQLLETDDGLGVIHAVLPRRNKFSRLAAGRKPLEQVIVANLDQVVAVFAAARPAPKWNLLDRYLVSAESLGLPLLICLTKMDLAQDDWELEAEIATYRQLGYPIVLTSAASGEGIAALRSALAGRISVFIGKSGVGKTSLLNALQPELGLRVRAVSQATDKGRHTTTSLELFPLEGGGVIDTPGMREFGLWEVDTGPAALGMLFPEVRPLLGTCRFGLDCSHTSEPGCAVKAALAAGAISRRRYTSYLKLAGG